MYPIIFSIGNVNIYSHGVMIVLGAFIGGYFIYKLAKKEKLMNFLILELAIVVMLAGFIGARLMYVLLYPDQFPGLIDKLSFWNGGMVSYGGMIGGFIGAAIYLKWKKQNVLQWFDISIFGFFIAWGVGRIGCFLNGDVAGLLSLSKYTIQARFPVPLYESALVLVIAGVLYKVFETKKAVWLKGTFFSLAFMFYGLGRFVIDFWRDDAYFMGPFNYSQLGDLLTIGFSIILFLVIMKMDKDAKVRSGQRKE